MPKKKVTKIGKETLSRPPIITIMGHVDHGKTTLLDAIRNTHIAEGEHGGITQHIGAYQIEVSTKEGPKKITFIDTPGHEAFEKMRSRGASITDIAVIVIDAKDSIMPQTIESIEHCRKAEVPFIIAINKIDLPEANIERVKKNLGDKCQVFVEGYGGDVVAVPLSAKTKEGIDTLLEMILLLAEMKNIKGDPEGLLDAVVIESRLDKSQGPLASVIVKNGHFSIGDEVTTVTTKGRIKALIDDQHQNIRIASPGMPVEVLGFNKLPEVGEKILPAGDFKIKEEVKNMQTPELKLPEAKNKKLNIILKCDTAGSLEAIKRSLSERIEIVSWGVGDINGSDILTAKSVQALVIGFNVKIPGSVKKLADNEKILVSSYQIIYLLLEELEDAAKYNNKSLPSEKILGKAKILAKFPSDKYIIAGAKVTEGRIAKNDTVRIERKDDIIGNAKIISMKHVKETIDKATMNMECGIIFDANIDFADNDAIISYRKTN